MNASQSMTLNNTMRRIAKDYPYTHILKTPTGYTVFCRNIDQASRISNEIDDDLNFSVKIEATLYVSAERSCDMKL